MKKEKQLRDMLELAKVSEEIERGFGQDSPMEQDLEQNSTLKKNAVENIEEQK